MALTRIGFTDTFGGAFTTGNPFPVEWPGGVAPLEGDFHVCVVIGYPADETALNALTVRSGVTEWTYLARLIVPGPWRPFGMVVAYRSHTEFSDPVEVDTVGGWAGGGPRWSAVVCGYRGAMDVPDRVETLTSILPATPLGVPQIVIPRDSGIVSIVAQATRDSDISLNHAGDFSVATRFGGLDDTGGARRGLWLDDLETYPPPYSVDWPTVNVRDAVDPRWSGQLCAITFNIPIVLFPPDTPRRGPYLGLRR